MPTEMDTHGIKGCQRDGKCHMDGKVTAVLLERGSLRLSLGGEHSNVRERLVLIQTVYSGNSFSAVVVFSLFLSLCVFWNCPFEAICLVVDCDKNTVTGQLIFHALMTPVCSRLISRLLLLGLALIGYCISLHSTLLISLGLNCQMRESIWTHN